MGIVFKTALIILFISAVTMLHPKDATADNDDALVDNISKILIKEYEKYKDRTSIEKLVLKLSKKAYIDSINDWKKNYNQLESIKIRLHPIIGRIVKIADRHLPEEEALKFRRLFENLTVLGYKNIQIFYISSKAYMKKFPEKPISIELINEALSEIEFYEQKLLLFDEEEKTKNEIREYFKDKRLKNKLAFYSFAFEYLDRIRVAIVKKDIENTKKKIKEKSEKNNL